jgi:choline-sulfatase
MCGSMRRTILALILVVTACRGEKPKATANPYAGAPVILISIDTLRADRLPVYGYGKGSTPAIDALRADGILYSNAYSHCPVTLPSHVSMLTGLLPFESGVRNNLGYRFDGAQHDSVPAMLHRAGYVAGAAVSAYVLRGDTGVGPLFDFYDDHVTGVSNVATAEVARAGDSTEAIAEEWVAQRAKERFFFFLHLYEPHWPYEPPEPFRSRFRDPYDGEIATADAIVQRFIARLKSLGVYDRALVFFVSDHGEGLGDHGEGEHGVFLYRETIHVPLIVKLPHSDRHGTTVDVPVQLIDLMPTIAEVTGAKPLGKLAGSSLLSAPGERRIYSETMLPRIHFGWSGLRALADARYHYIEAPRSELYDIPHDPRERANIANRERRTFSAMRQAMTRYYPSTFTAPTSVDPEEAKKLAALGYIGEARTTEDGGDLPDPKDGIADLEKMKAAGEMQRRGRLADALALLRSIVAHNPRFADAWLRLAAVQEQTGDIDGAFESYRHAITAAPVLAPDIAITLGSLDLRIHRLDEAAAHASLALKASPGAAHHLLGRIALARRDYETAAQEAREAAQSDLYQAAGNVLLARVLTEQGLYPAALQLLDKAKGAAAGAPVRDLEATRGDILARMERPDEAEHAFKEEIAQFPQSTDAYTRLAFRYIILGRSADAEALLKRMTSVVPGRSSALLASEVWKASGNAEAAARWRARAK